MRGKMYSSSCRQALLLHRHSCSLFGQALLLHRQASAAHKSCQRHVPLCARMKPLLLYPRSIFTSALTTANEEQLDLPLGYIQTYRPPNTSGVMKLKDYSPIKLLVNQLDLMLVKRQLQPKTTLELALPERTRPDRQKTRLT